MDVFLSYFVFIMLVIVVGLGINSKTFKMPPEIALLICSLIIGIVFKLCLSMGIIPSTGTLMETITTFKVDELLMDTLLCFMLFSGASDLKFTDLKHHFKPIALLAFLTTALTTLVYAVLIYFVMQLFGFSGNFLICLLIGAIISPTDPIAATGILNKLGLPEDITTIMEGESLFNDGVGVALFIFIQGIITNSNEAGFFAIMSKELLGAIVVGCAVSFICTMLVKFTDSQEYHIMVSLLAVSSCYVICEIVGFSGVIASVICGIYFATVIENSSKTISRTGSAKRDIFIYDNFWTSIDKLLNYVLYVIIGISFIFVVRLDIVLPIALIAIVVNLAARYAGVFVSTLLIGKDRPKGYSINQFTALMTWSGLKGGLCLAMVMSCITCVNAEIYNTMMFVVFATIGFTTIIQGLTVDKLYLRIDKKVKAKLAALQQD